MLVSLFLSLNFIGLTAPSLHAQDKPNIVYLICDDLGFGDVQCCAPETSKIKTPCADQLAREGMLFTDTHSGSSVCTPTRYGLLTGRYAWRTHLQKGVVQGFAPCLIVKDRPTVASYLKSQGYATAIIGKWHLNFQYVNSTTNETLVQSGKPLPVGTKIADGPLEHGFDYFHGFHHARRMEVVVENEAVIANDDPVNMLPRLTKKAVEYIDSRAGKKGPFFLYVPLGSPHTPILPTKEWKGKSGLGSYADFVMQTDNVAGEISKALEKHGMADNTLVIFTSDNGCSKRADIKKLKSKGHAVSGKYRGSKADLWDGGHRIPFIVRWPGKIKPGSQSDQLVCLTDLFATVSEITGQPLPKGSAEDSVSFLPALSEKPIASTRNGVIHHSYSGHFSYRHGDWKLLLASGSGGWTAPKIDKNGPKVQLYDMAKDPGEKTNLQKQNPDVVEKLLKLLEEDIHRGRSTDGPDSINDIPKEEIRIWKDGITTVRKNENKKTKKRNSASKPK